MEPNALLASIRFGLGPRRGEPLPADPIPWLEAQLGPAAPPPVPEGYATAPTPPDAYAAFRRDREAQAAGDPQPGNATRLFRAEALAQAQHLLLTPQPFRERLVMFWANHFTCSRRSGQVGPMMGDYLRQAIRPHVTGRFEDMLLAVVRHPAMLVYLDNVESMGPESPAVRRSGRGGLNENLAREILELHTVSPAAGYAQRDVTEFARLLTGWGVGYANRPDEVEGQFIFRPPRHEPGAKHILGASFEEGEAGGVRALRWLASHPATHRHLAFKLARHFVADTPPEDAVARLEAVLRATDGDLGAVSRALLRLPAAWAPLTKLRSPQEYVVAMLRAVGAGTDSTFLVLDGLNALGQSLWATPGPNGWPDTAAEWVTPEAMLRRVDFAWGVAARVAASVLDVRAIADHALGPLARAETVSAVSRAGSVREALTLMLGSPEFQRR